MAELTFGAETLLKNFIYCFLFLIGSYFLLRRNPRLKYHFDQLGGPTPLPLFGNSLSLLRPHKDFIKISDDWVERYGSAFGMWIGPFLAYVFISDADVIEKLISSMRNTEKTKDYNLFNEWLGTGLLTARKEKWVHRRKLLTPTFHFKILEDFMPIFNEQATVLLECLEKGNAIGKPVNIYPFILDCTLDIICETAMGKKINAQIGTENKEYINAINGMCSLLMDKMTKPWLRIPILGRLSSAYRLEKTYLKIIKQFTGNVIQARKRERIEQKNSENKLYTRLRRKAFLDLLLDTSENGADLKDSDIQDEVDTFMFEGHDTTGVSLVWTIFLLASNPECQKLARQELDDIFSDNPRRDVTIADLPRMKYIESCIKESLRLYPSVPIINREIEEDIPFENGKIIPKGAKGIINIYYLHRNPKCFPEPEKFKPERFYLPNEFPKRSPYSYIPFSAGPRNCIGQKFALMEEKVILAKFLRTFEIKPVDTLKDISIIPDVILRCEGGIKVLLKRRNDLIQ